VVEGGAGTAPRAGGGSTGRPWPGRAWPGRAWLRRRRRGCRQLDGPARDVDLVETRPLGQALDRVAISIPRREVHRRERPVGTQDVVDDADALDELRPVEPRDQAHAR